MRYIHDVYRHDRHCLSLIHSLFQKAPAQLRVERAGSVRIEVEAFYAHLSRLMHGMAYQQTANALASAFRCDIDAGQPGERKLG